MEKQRAKIIVKIFVLCLLCVNFITIANADDDRNKVSSVESKEEIVLQKQNDSGAIAEKVNEAEIEADVAIKKADIQKKALELKKKRVSVEIKEAEIAKKEAQMLEDTSANRSEIKQAIINAEQEQKDILVAQEKLKIAEEKMLVIQRKANIAEDALQLAQKRAEIAEIKIKEKQKVMYAKLAQTGLALLIGVLLIFFLKRGITRIVERRKLRTSRAEAMDKVVTLSIVISLTFVLILIWGIDAKSLWIFLTSILGVLSIGLFAVWSILSNIIAGIFLFAADNFRINDEILIIGDEVRGKVLRMKLLFVVLRDDDNNIIHIPNSLFFQKSVKKFTKGNV